MAEPVLSVSITVPRQGMFSSEHDSFIRFRKMQVKTRRNERRNVS